MHFDKDSLKHLSRLCRIDCNDEEIEKLHVNLEAILSHIDQLDEIETRGVAPCLHVNSEQTLTLEEDEPRDPIKHQDLLRNAPDSVGGMVKVPPILG